MRTWHSVRGEICPSVTKIEQQLRFSIQNILKEESRYLLGFEFNGFQKKV